MNDNPCKPRVKIISPEEVLGRKMSRDEIDKILDEIKAVNVEILKHRLAVGDLSVKNDQGENNGKLL
ncbi:MAG: hypothetical protein R3Y64_10650 [Peptostreptococcaceae bacterium]